MTFHVTEPADERIVGTCLIQDDAAAHRIAERGVDQGKVVMLFKIYQH